MEYYSARKGMKYRYTLYRAQVNLKKIMWSVGSCIQGTTYCIIQFIRNLQSRNIYTESRSLVAWGWGWAWGLTARWHLLGVTEMFKNWIAAIAAQLGKFTRNHWNVHFKWVHVMICELNLNKAAAKPKAKGADPGHNGPSSCSSWFTPMVKSLPRNTGGEDFGPGSCLKPLSLLPGPTVSTRTQSECGTSSWDFFTEPLCFAKSNYMQGNFLPQMTPLLYYPPNTPALFCNAKFMPPQANYLGKCDTQWWIIHAFSLCFFFSPWGW